MHRTARNDAADALFSHYRELAHANGFDRVEIAIKADGRITLVGYNARGFHEVKQLADLHPDSCDPKVPEALDKFDAALQKKA